ncbi:MULTISPECIES: sugar phosphate nucleotidyltransferase [Paenibacillus]|uniref:Glucose-1-phosphate thymidylyltransferase n=1 Tax=Paenibacillus lautus TaxID=1401 RepID=A0A1R1ASU3_PAELA|nr:sugar phosphate nucleotidyltransferase [Paenibacillus lautus]OME88614.1 hypothetical protein BK123_30525 [Paenibacillus lautus]
MKGLILCAGKGSRLYPFTRSYPKSLLPVANAPLLHACIDKLVEQQITEIGIVIHPSQETLIRASLEYVKRWNADFTYIFQYEPKGIANAVLLAQSFIGNHSFIMLLGDNLISISLSELRERAEAEGNHATLLLGEVDTPQDYGIAEVKDNRIVRLEEKPQAPKSNQAVLGAYVFTPTLFEAARKIKASARGEYEITDAIQWLIERGYQVSYAVADKPNIDVGTVPRWLEANRVTLQARRTSDIHPSVVLENCTLIEPVSIAEGTILKDCTIGPYVSIGASSFVENCHLENCVVMGQVHLKQLLQPLENTVIGHGSVLLGVR